MTYEWQRFTKRMVWVGSNPMNNSVPAGRRDLNCRPVPGGEKLQPMASRYAQPIKQQVGVARNNVDKLTHVLVGTFCGKTTAWVPQWYCWLRFPNRHLSAVTPSVLSTNVQIADDRVDFCDILGGSAWNSASTPEIQISSNKCSNFLDAMRRITNFLWIFLKLSN